MKYLPSWPLALLIIAILFPVFPVFDERFFNLTGRTLGDQLPGLFIFAILALALNVVVGYTGVLHLGIAAFFGIGAYVVGIATVPSYPFGMNVGVAIGLAAAISALVGILIGIPSLRLRGDYLALVTLGFGEVVRFSIKNLEPITAGSDGLSPLPAPRVPYTNLDWDSHYQPFYYLTLFVLVCTYYILARLERSKLGRAWVAVREDELAASCMGLNASRLKLAAFGLSAGLAGLAGGLYATKMTSTVGPDAYDFNRSVFVLCCLILGGLANRNGVLFGVILLYGFDNILAPMLDQFVQHVRGESVSKVYQTFSGWRLMLFGIVLILVMRFRPEGLLPSNRVRDEEAFSRSV
ncbi:MAG: branched-chain amino acid ABC transporter permease [Gemmataceae bacterium]